MRFFLGSFISIVLIFSLTSAHSSSDFDDGLKFTSHDSKQFNIGVFALNYTTTTTFLEDELRIKKTTQKFRLENKLTHTSASAKVNIIHEFVRCENLTLINPSYAEQIDCKSLNEHYGSTAGLSESNRNYVLRQTYKVKSKGLSAETKRILHLYPLKSQVVHQSIAFQSFASQIESNGLDFGEHSVKEGVYMEMANNMPAGDVLCSGRLLVNLNETESELPQDASELELDLLSSLRKGFMLSVQNLKCHDTNLGSEKYLLTNFVVILQQQFPYIYLRHSMITQPDDGIFKYDAAVDQKRDTINTESYNTSVSINSTSQAVQMLNFHLEQNIENPSSTESRESASFWAGNLGIVVEADWFNNSFVKVVDLIRLIDQPYDTPEKVIDDRSRKIRFKYIDEDGHDDVEFNLKIKREYVDTIVSALQLPGLINIETGNSENNMREEL